MIRFCIAAACASALAGRAFGDEAPSVGFKVGDGRIEIVVAGRPFAIYVYRDPKITRPYFFDVRSPGGTAVTRNHPPVAGKDLTDHADMHPGLWLAFGDVGGADVWRNKAKVVHEEFAAKPESAAGRGTFAVRNRYENAGKIVCRETCRYTVVARPDGTLLVCESEFAADGAVAFGDQEEMGFGVRMATALSEKNGGAIRDADGRKTAKAIWGKQSDWCSYGGEVQGRRVGVVLMTDPANPRRSWFHVRDYGLMVANPFGKLSARPGEPASVVLEKGKTLRLRFGVFVHDRPRDVAVDEAAAYKVFLDVIGAAK